MDDIKKKDIANGITILLLAALLCIGMLFVNWLITIGVIWLICFLLSPFGVEFDLAIATVVWLVLRLLKGVFGGSSSKE